MAATYEPIASTTLGSDAFSYTFSSIPSTYTDLRLIVHGRTSRASIAYDTVNFRFNGDTGTTYSRTRLYGNGSSAGSDGSSSADLWSCWIAAELASAPSLVTLDIFSYANTNVYKTGLSTSSQADQRVEKHVSLWRNTAAITSIQVFATASQSSNLVAGTTISLYGLAAA